MKPYPAYKDSGIEWIGEIPEHWNINLVKRVVKSHKQGYYSSDSYVDDGVKLLRITDIDDYTNVDFANCPFVSISEKEMKDFGLEVNDFIFARSGTIGRFGIVNQKENAVFASYLIKFKFSEDLETLFLKYYFLSNYFKQSLISDLHGGANQNIHAENIKAPSIVYPSLREQQSIASFLDNKTSQIDTLIEKKQKQIELLKEERTAIINQAVTKGLNPDVPMKDSGIEWLGEVPEHWNNHKISHIATKITNGYVGPTRDILMENGVRYLQSLHIKNNEISFNPPYYVSQKWSNMHKRSILEKGDVLVVQTGDIGQVAVVKEDFAGCNCHALIILTPDGTNVNGEYLSLILNSNYGYHTLKSIQTGALHPHLNSSNVKDIQVPLPPLKEQIQIMEFLHNYSTTNSTSVKTIKQQITLLQEYRTSLISNAVTGKIDVREYHGNST